VSINLRLNWNINSQFDWRLQSTSTKLRANLSNCAVYIYTRLASHMDNYILRVLESANQTISISAQTMKEQKILYTHKHCEIIHIRNVRFLFSFFSIQPDWATATCGRVQLVH
jgi:hypothetical protein